jgi:Cu/Ag efflux pump CusA
MHLVKTVWYGYSFRSTNRQDINDLKPLRSYPLRRTNSLQELANIAYTEGPAKISRDNTNRRSRNQCEKQIYKV